MIFDGSISTTDETQRADEAAEFREEVDSGIANSFHQLGLLNEEESYFELFSGTRGVSHDFNVIWRSREMDLSEETTQKFRNSMGAYFESQKTRIANRYLHEKPREGSANINLNVLFDVDIIEDITAKFIDGAAEDKHYSQIVIDEFQKFLQDINTEIDIKFNNINVIFNQFRKLDPSLDVDEVILNFQNIVNGNYGVKVNYRKFHTFDKKDILDLVDKAHLAGMKVFRINSEWTYFKGKDREIFLDIIQETFERAKSYGMTNVLFMHHFTYPKDVGEPNAKYFVDNYINYIKEFMGALKTRATFPDHLYLFNEPFAFLPQGLIAGAWPPFVQNAWEFMKGVFNTLSAYDKAYSYIKSECPEIEKIGFSENLPVFLPIDRTKFTHRLAADLYGTASEIWMLGIFALSVKNRDFVFDIFGLQQYGAHRVSLKNLPSANPGELLGQLTKDALETMANGWAFVPEAVAAKLLRLYRYFLIVDGLGINSLELPRLAITENGVASLTRADKQFDLLKRSIELAGSLLPEGVMYNLMWSIFGDTSEWGEFLKQTSGFGFFDAFGEEKPVSERAYENLNFSHPMIIHESKGLVKAMNGRLNRLDARKSRLEKAERDEELEEEYIKVNQEINKLAEYIDKNNRYILFFDQSIKGIKKLESEIELYEENSGLRVKQANILDKFRKNREGKIKNLKDYEFAKKRLAIANNKIREA